MQKVFCNQCIYFNIKGYCKKLKMAVRCNNYCSWYIERIK